MPWHQGWTSGWGWVAMLVVILLIVAVLAVAVVLALQVGSRPFVRRAEDVLAERFARGEIDADEYERRRATLRSGG
ncbi:MAG TPA: SHOCT domain-containing protein [Jatrophihabitans sp.]|nr:SHOCT domain-containing protein [Jatrophihabitans sp.]